ncbi:MAG TPA: site-2 protease family protein [Ktedonobacterales bacterium]|nr:site-2 protease family protein [Ktedonobacterales bacterium]
MIGNPRQSPYYPGMNNRYTGSVGQLILRSINWAIVAGLLLVFGFFGWILWQNQPSTVALGTVGFVLVGWIFSLCLHEFGHAVTAVLGGDTSPGTIRYLSFNPLHYVNPLLSIIMPVVFVLLGGIALPGGAVYLRRDLVRNRAWQSAISLAGPFGNLLFLLGLALVMRTNLLNGHESLQFAVALLAFFQVMAIVLNLLPIPPLDGFGVISPWLPREFAQAALSIGMYSFILLFVLLWYVPIANTMLFGAVDGILLAVGIDPGLAQVGYYNLFFWRH